MQVYANKKVHIFLWYRKVYNTFLTTENRLKLLPKGKLRFTALPKGKLRFTALPKGKLRFTASPKAIFLSFIFILFSAVFSFAAESITEELPSIPPFTRYDRILILAPHPDDETIGAAGAIQQAIKAGADVNVVCYTNGDANQLAFIAYEKRLTFLKGEFLHMGEVRRKETISALEFLGVNQNKIFFLGYPDFGTMQIMLKYWGTTKPYRSLFTRVSGVPYEENLSPHALYIGDNILKDIERVLLKIRPTKIFVSHPADTNTDHQSLYLFMQVALWDLQDRIKRPLVYPFLVHCLRWPLPRGYHLQQTLLPPQDFVGRHILWQRLQLTDEEVQVKKEAFNFYKSQIPYNPLYLSSFARKNELFGDYPIISLREERSAEINWHDVELSEDASVTSISYAKKDGKLYIKLSFNRQITKGIKSLIHLLGYSKNHKFSGMPKIRLLITRTRLLIYNKKSRIFVDGSKMSVQGNSIMIECPLAALNSPGFILSRARIHTSNVPPDVLAWRILKIE